MAIIRSLQYVTDKKIPTQSETAADYTMDDEYFSIWSYTNGDFNRNGECHQNMQFNRQQAKELMTALDKFINK